ELHRHRLADQLRVELRLLDLLDVDEDLAVGLLLDLLLELVDFRPLAPDDDAGARRVDVDLQLVRGALGLDLRHARVGEPLLERRAQLEVLVQQLGVVAIRVPARPPRLVEAEAESERVNLLTHDLSSAALQGPLYTALKGPPYRTAPHHGFAAFFDGVVADLTARARRGRGASPAAPEAAGTALTLSTRSDTCTVRCAVRFSTRN